MKLLPGTAPGSSIVKVKTTRIGAANISPRKGKVLEAKVKIIEITKILRVLLLQRKNKNQIKIKKNRQIKEINVRKS